MSTQFAAFDRLKATLLTGGIDEESATFILDKLKQSVTDQVAAEIVAVTGEEAVNKLSEGDAAAQLADLEAKFKEKKGKSIAEFREEVAEKMVAEFEAIA